jgi:cardiolipin synthase A/B
VRDWRETTGAVLGGDDYFPEVDAPGDVTAQIVASAPNGGSSESYMLFLFSIATARRSIYVTNPYFVIDDQMKDALIQAQRRGVQVMIIVPGQLDSKFFRLDQNLVHYAGRGEIGRLLKAGIRVFAYRPALLHAKTMVVDGTWAIIGSTNFDHRSFELNKEINLTVLDARVAARVEEIFRDDLGRCHELSYDEWARRGPVERVFEWFAVPAKSQL